MASTAAPTLDAHRLRPGEVARAHAAVERVLRAELVAHLVGDAEGTARDLTRPPAQDLFGHGSQEAVLAAVLTALRCPERYETLLDLPPAERAAALLTGPDAPPLDAGAAALVERLLAVSLTGDGR